MIKSMLVAMAGLGLLAGAAIAQAPTSRPVTEGEQVQFQQKNASAQFQELEERMYRLAELIRESEPSDSARLLMGVQRARQELISEQMKQIVAFIGEKDLTRAAGEQKEVLQKLEELKRLLTTGDLDLALQLERLKKLQAAIEKLDVAIKEETRQAGQSTKLSQAQKKKEAVEPSKFEQAKKDQQSNRQANDAIAQMLKSLGEGPAKSAQGLAGASQSMSSAEASFSSRNASGALTQQDQALGAMKKVRQELEQERQKLLAEIERQVKKQVIENLTRMLETQIAVRQATEALSPRLSSGQRQVEMRIRQLGATQQKIADLSEATVDLVERTGFSIALPPALKNIQRRATYVAVDLRAGRGGETIIVPQKQIEKDIQDLIDTFRQLPSNPGPGGRCKSCNSDKNKLLAELKVLRMLQLRVNEETLDIDGRRGRALASTDLDEETRKMLGSTVRHQADVRDATDKIHQAICPDCLSE